MKHKNRSVPRPLAEIAMAKAWGFLVEDYPFSLMFQLAYIELLSMIGFLVMRIVKTLPEAVQPKLCKSHAGWGLPAWWFVGGGGMETKMET